MFYVYCEIITKWQKDGYPFVTDDIMRQNIAIFDEKLRKLAREGNKEAAEQVAYIDNLFEISEGTSFFNLKEYMIEQLMRCGIKEEIVKKFVEKVKNARSVFVAPRERLANFDLTGKDANEEKIGLFRENVTQIVNKLCSAKQKTNRVLADSLKQHPLIMKFQQGDFHASMGECVVKGILQPVLWMSVPDFKNLPDESLLATTLGHEFGHWLDFSNRPQECLFENSLMQECFADVIGCQIAKNAGYDIRVFVERVKGFEKYFEEQGMLDYKKLSEKRRDLIENCFHGGCSAKIIKNESISVR